MKILPISSNQPKFMAKLPKKELYSVMDSALCRDSQAGIQKLYTILECLDKMPGKNAELTSLIANSQSQLIGYMSRRDNTCQLRIDNKLVSEGTNIYDVLYSAATCAKTNDGKKIAMPSSVFDLMWWKNRAKTVQDLEQFFRE